MILLSETKHDPVNFKKKFTPYPKIYEQYLALAECIIHYQRLIGVVWKNNKTQYYLWGFKLISMVNIK